MLVAIPSHQITDWFDRVQPFLVEAIARSGGRYSLRTIVDGLLDHSLQLWASVNDEEIDAAAITRIVDWPTGLRVCVILMGGGNLESLKTHQTDVAEWAKAHGCTRFEVWGRRGFERALADWREAFSVMETSL